MAAPRRSASLRKRYCKRWDIPLLLLGSGLLILWGLTLPAVETRTLVLWRNEYSILLNLQNLSREGKQVAATILALCAVVYPAVKLIVLTYFWMAPFPYVWRARVIRVLQLLGRWSMVDVFTVTTIILASLTIGPLEATPRSGLYLYAGGIVTLMLVTIKIEKLARYGRR